MKPDLAATHYLQTPLAEIFSVRIFRSSQIRVIFSFIIKISSDTYDAFRKYFADK